MKKVFAILLALSLTFTFFTGCTAKEEAAAEAPVKEEAPAKEEAAAEAPATEDAPAEEKKLHFGMLLDNQTNGWQVMCYKYAQAACDELGIELTMYQCEEDSAKQVDQLQSLIELGIDGLLLDPVLGDTGLVLLEMCEEEGIPTICFDRADYTIVDDFDCYLSFVGPDSVDAGYQLGKYMIEELGVTKFIELDGMAGSDPCIDRAEGFAKARSEHPEVEVLAAQNADWDMTLGMNTAQDLLGANPDATGIWAANDDMALGAMAACEAMNRTDIIVGGMDCSDAGVEALLENGQYKITVGAHYICSAISVICLYDYLHGCEIPEMISFNMLAVTADNAQAMLDLNANLGLIKGKCAEYSAFLNPNADPDRWVGLLDIKL